MIKLSFVLINTCTPTARKSNQSTGVNIYTNVGSILVAANPFQFFDIYGPDYQA